MAVEIFIAVLIFAISVWYLATPVINYRHGSRDDHGLLKERRLENLRLKKEEVLTTLKDLQLDRDTQKISEEDYEKLYQETFAFGTKLLEEMDQVTNEKDPMAAPTSESGLKKAAYCHQCGSALVANARFCSQCGTSVPL